MSKYIIGVAILFLVIGAGCNLNSQTQLETDTKVEDTTVESSNSVNDETMLKDDATDTDALVDVGVDGEVLVKLDTGLEADADAMLDTKLDVMKKDSDQPKTEDPKKEMEKDAEKKTSGTYEDYSPSKLALASSGKVVLFFKANWCPTCVAFDKSVMANLSTIPAGTHILKVDYDNSTELKKKYGVTYQHTYVQVDAQGNLITKWSASTNVADVVTHIK